MTDTTKHQGGANLRDATVYVITTQGPAGRIVDVEVLDSPPRWDPLPGQTCRVASVNGGDSSPFTWGTK